ncbi:TIGR03620 family F420-dependent LLM class oxidoreductase [Novosphingobium sp. PC22D]|uniref:TIGR03620 family F420-dependent LLM class oxidoreductase n=1 Tax=Novosphingobium sp. PC22D TaxID=1962403 RepID=UPI000BF11465|nr:TIGR03620 family F420-dependent LLM class oxidoreductase [Novosphingobium sp. PC22D]
MTVPKIGKVGIWSLELRFGDPDESSRAAAEIEKMGFGTIWIPGGIDDGAPGDVERLLRATSTITIATGILNIWKHDPAELAAWFAGLAADQQARTLLGIGVSHGPLIGEAWAKPLAKTSAFLDGFLGAGMPADNVCLAALGPKMLALSGERTAGAHPYLVSPSHSAEARAILGPDKLLAPEQGVILETDPGKARELAVEALAHYRELPNYRNNWHRLGFTETEINDLDDRLLHALFAMGDASRARERVREHHAAGADHVCMQVIGCNGSFDALVEKCRQLAKVLF